jgi:hypothetical protein
MLYELVIAFLMAFICLNINAKEISGYVKDFNTCEPLAFSNVLIKGTSTGTMADSTGHLRLSLSENISLYISSVGYFPVQVPVKAIANEKLKYNND